MRLSSFEAIVAALNGAGVRFMSIPTLIAMKEIANRARDRDDIEHLQMNLEEQRKR
jgi:hypothetical protein